MKKWISATLFGSIMIFGFGMESVKAVELDTVRLVKDSIMEQVANTWDKTGLYYYDANGDKVTGFQIIDNHKYYFDANGLKQTGFITVNQKLYYSYDSGLILNGFYQKGNNLYYFDYNGTAAKGLYSVADKTYFFNDEHIAQTGFQRNGNDLYYFDSNDKTMIKNKWIEEDSFKYYMKEDGKAASDITKIGNYTYYFDSNFHMYTDGWKSKGNDVLFFNRITGKLYQNQWYIEGGKTYYINERGARVSGKRDIAGKAYYFDNNGVQQLGFITAGNDLYYSYGSGIAKNAWYETAGNRYYFGSDGKAASDVTTIGKYTYYFDRTHRMYTDGWKSKGAAVYFFNKVTGKLYQNQWYTEKGDTYYIQENGTRATGLVNIEKKLYYFKSDGTKQLGFINANGNLFYSYHNGVIQNNWFETKGDRYYFGNKGKAAKNITEINNSMYYFDSEHVMYKGFKTINDKLYLFDKVSGQMYKNNVYTDQSGTYYFNDKGVVSTKPGWVKINGKSYLFNNNNEIVEGATKFVIDISEHNGIVDWDKVKASGVDGVILRIGYGYDESNVTKQIDKKFIRNVRELERVGLPYGIYHFSYATSVEDAAKEAQYVLDLMKITNAKPTLPVYYDLERTDYIGDLDKDLYTKMAITFCEKIKKAGYGTGIYANLNYFQTKLSDSSLDSYTKWVAQYNQNNGEANHCDYQKKYKMWQYTSVGKVNGIIGNVDLNAMY